MEKEIFKKYFGKVVRESILKSLLCAAVIGFSVLFVFVTISWLNGFKAGLFIGLGLLGASLLIATPLFYRFKFRPTTKKLAHRIDMLGLEERIITMTQLENDTSFIAMKQREDALNAIKTVNSEMLKIAISLPMIISTAVCGVLGTGVTVASAVAPDAGTKIVDSFKEKRTFELTYTVQGDGWVIDFSKRENAALIQAVAEREKQREKDKINGKEVAPDTPMPSVYSKKLNAALTAEGEDTKATIVLDGVNDGKVEYKIKAEEGENISVSLLALPKKGFVFVGWSDGVTSPYREELTTEESKTITAKFDAVETLEDAEQRGNEDGNGDGEGDSDSKGDSSGDGNNQKPGSGGMEGDGMGARDSYANRVIDGEIYYGDIFDAHYKDELERIKNSTTLSEEEKKVLAEYMESIRKE